MKTTPKHLFSMIGLLLLVVPFLQAADESASQPPSGQPGLGRRERGPGRPGAMMQRAVQELGLTAEQEAKWKEIGEQERAALQALRTDAEQAEKDRRAKAMEINKNFAEQRRAVLNAEQQQKFDEMRAKMGERIREHRGSGAPGPRGGRGPRGPMPGRGN